MCGIAGFHLAAKEAIRFQPDKLAEALLTEIVSRGTDATGVAWTQRGDDKKREVWYSKQAVRAESFIKNGGLKHMPKKTLTVLCHTRMATQGSKAISDNNHPITVPGVIGVHNGHIANDDELFQEYGWNRIGQVDSEAAFHLIANRKTVEEALPQLRGTAALAWTETTDSKWDGVLHLARCSGSPLAVAQTKRGSVIFASTETLLKAALDKVNIKDVEMFNVAEWTYLRVHDGTIHEWRDLPKPEPKFPSFTLARNWYSQPQLPWSQESQKRKDQEKMREFGWMVDKGSEPF